MSNVARIISLYARQYGVDPRAAMAIANYEGGLHWGAVGDQGTSYGPFQLHVGGALPRGRNAAWANSPAGIAYAIRQMAGSGARGLTGRAAVSAISRNFERPADPATEIARAMQWYSGHGGISNAASAAPPSGASPLSSRAGGAQQGGGVRQMAAQMLMNFAQTGMVGGSDQTSPFASIMQLQAMARARQGDAQHAPAAMPGGQAGGRVPMGGGLSAPLPSMTLTSGYGPRVGVVNGETFHYGVDLSAPTGTPIHAMVGGKVLFAGMYGSGGYTVIVKDAQGREWFYHHMYRPPGVHVGQTIGVGSVLGGVGQTGAATGPHLHVGLQVKGHWVDPTRFIRRAFRRR